MNFNHKLSPEQALALIVDEKAFAEKLLKEEEPKGNAEWIEFIKRKIKNLEKQIKELETEI